MHVNTRAAFKTMIVVATLRNDIAYEVERIFRLALSSNTVNSVKNHSDRSVDLDLKSSG